MNIITFSNIINEKRRVSSFFIMIALDAVIRGVYNPFCLLNK